MPIKTFVREAEADTVREAIVRELDRGGQVFFVHNRVENIGHVADQVQKLVPYARMRHRPRPDGRKRARAGDDGLLRAQVRRARLHDDHRERPGHPQRQHDHHQRRRQARPRAALPAPGPRRALGPAGVCVSALQAGQDAQRGRREAARCHPRVHRPRQRLPNRACATWRSAARATYSEPSRAVRWRPWASISTASCSRKAVAELKGEEVEEIELPPVDLPIDAYIPQGYMPTEAHRILFYKKMAAVKNKADVQAVQDELEDRFGDPPKPGLEHAGDHQATPALPRTRHRRAYRPSGTRFRSNSAPASASPRKSATS